MAVRRIPLTVRKGPAPIIDERRFVPTTVAQVRALYVALVADGNPVSKARGITTWATVLPARRADDPTSDNVRWEYRKALARLGSPPWERDEDTGADISSPAEIAA